MTQLADKQCVPCKGDTPPLTPEQIKPLLDQLDGWQVQDDHHLHRDYKFPDFKTALAFVNQVGDVAEELGHHPNIEFTWGKVSLDIYTHKIGGLSESDFVLAAKIDKTCSA